MGLFSLTLGDGGAKMNELDAPCPAGRHERGKFDPLQRFGGKRDAIHAVTVDYLHQHVQYV